MQPLCLLETILRVAFEVVTIVNDVCLLSRVFWASENVPLGLSFVEFNCECFWPPSGERRT